MAPFEVTRQKKLAVLNKIREEKQILFGAFSGQISKTLRVEKWKEVHLLAQSIGLVKIDKQWTYTRDVLWPNIKKGTMAKVDIKKIGTGGERKVKYNEVDNLVLDIIGKDSCITRLGVEETWREAPNIALLGAEQNNENENKIIIEVPVITPRLSPVPSTSESTERGKSCNHDTEDEEMRALKKRKLQLQIEHLELINEKVRLEIEKMKEGSLHFFPNVSIKPQDQD